MTALTLIDQARVDGLELRPNGDRIKLIGPSAVVERWTPAIAANKAAILAALAANTAPIAPDLERLIVRAGAFWEYSPDDYALIREIGRRDPDGLRLALATDPWLYPIAPHPQKEATA